jgi:hypothetical protein
MNILPGSDLQGQWSATGDPRNPNSSADRARREVPSRAQTVEIWVQYIATCYSGIRPNDSLASASELYAGCRHHKDVKKFYEAWLATND